MLRIYVKNPPAPVEIPVPGLELTFDDIANVPVADASSVSDWNTFFDLPTNGTPFTSVVVSGDMVKLIGGSGITLRYQLFNEVTYLIKVIDSVDCVIIADDTSIVGCSELLEITLPALTETIFTDAGALCRNTKMNVLNLPALTTAAQVSFFENESLTVIDFKNALSIGIGCFSSCINLETINLNSCTDLGGSTGETGVFNLITGQTITLTIPAALMTCNAGNPDGDIAYLQANNTVTIATV